MSTHVQGMLHRSCNSVCHVKPATQLAAGATYCWLCTKPCCCGETKASICMLLGGPAMLSPHIWPSLLFGVMHHSKPAGS